MLLVVVCDKMRIENSRMGVEVAIVFFGRAHSAFISNSNLAQLKGEDDATTFNPRVESSLWLNLAIVILLL